MASTDGSGTRDHFPIRRTLFMLALPVLGEQLLNTFVGLFDTFLAGRISATATSAVGLGAYVSWLAQLMVMLVGTGTTALVARCQGADDPASANRFANQSLTLGFLLGIAASLGLFLMAPTLTRYSNMTDEAASITVQYLRVDAAGYLFLSITLVGCAAMRGVGNMHTPMLIFAVINVVNVIASWSLVYGFGPIPRLGVTGIVAGTVIAKVIGATMTVAILARGRAGLRLKSGELRLRAEPAWRILRIGIPAATDGAVMWIGQFVFLGILSRLAGPPLGQAYFAAHVIAVRVEAFTYLPAVAWGAATATMIGQALGARNPHRARLAGHEGVKQCGLLALVIGSVFILAAVPIYKTMSVDELVRSVGPGPFRILALLQPCLVLSIVYIAGLRGAGDTRYPMMITIAGAAIRVSLGYLGGIAWNGGLLGAWIGMFADMIWRALAASIRFLRGRWVHIRV